MAQESGRRVLITGVANPLAAALARRLEGRREIAYIGGLDTAPPGGLGRTEFIRADLRRPLVARVVESTRVDTIVHLGLQTMASQAGGRARMKELNVIGSMQLLAAAQKASRVRQLVVRSSTAVYGSDHRNPAMLAEDAPTAPERTGFSKDAAEVEGYARGVARRRSDVSVTVFRFANTVGPTVDSPLTRYFSLPAVPTLLGYDPRIQLLHEDDAVGVLEASVLEARPGVYNVAGPGAMYLSQAVRLAGRPTVPFARPLMPWVAGTLRRAGLVDFSADQLQYLLHGRICDIRRLCEEFGFTPSHSTRAAFEAFLEARGIEPVIHPETVLHAEEWALRMLTRPEGGSR